MNFNYSYRAFLITSLLFGILFLTLWSIQLSSEIPEAQETLPVEYEEMTPFEETLAAEVSTTKISTNRAYNEAERFIQQIENERLEAEESQEISDPLNETSEAFSPQTQEALEEAKQRIKTQKANVSKAQKITASSTKEKGVNRKTTIRYSLKDRKPLELPNPVYTCEAGGKVVISVEVNELGKVVKTRYNVSASTTTNGCLIDSALNYAAAARFNTKAGQKQQQGTITYVFPGQG
jgi:DNA primase